MVRNRDGNASHYPFLLESLFFGQTNREFGEETLAGTTRTRATVARKQTGRKSPVQRPHIVSQPSQSDISRDFTAFMESWKEKKFYEISNVVQQAVSRGKVAKTPGKKMTVKIPTSSLGQGASSERMMMQALGWYWEPLLHDLAFYEEMRDSIALFDGEIQKLVDTALDGFNLQCDDPEAQEDLNKALLRNPQVNFRETLRSAMVDVFSLGNAYRIPIWGRDDQGRLIPKTFKPVRATAMRKLRDENLLTEGYVQLLHRPSELLFGASVTQTPTIYKGEDVLCGIMRSKHWYAYGTPLLASVPFIVRLKLTMERDLAEMLHKHVPRIDITFTPEEQMTDEQVTAQMNEIKNDVSKLKLTDNYAHTPDTEFEYKGPAGKGLDFANPQKHTEDQLFYVLPFAQSIMGLSGTENPFASQQHWKISAIIANALRQTIEMMFAPSIDAMAKDWGLDTIKMSWSQLDPESNQQNAESEELTVNNAVLKRDNGFIDQDVAARQATAHHPDGPVKKAAEPGKLPPPLDPNKPDPASQPINGKVRKMGPKTDGTKAGDRDNRPKGRRHAFYDEMVEYALSQIE